MKTRDIIKRGAKLSACLLTAGLLAACTGNFEEYNTNPFGPTPEDMLGDNAITNSLIKSMMPVLVQGQQNNSQMIDQMIGSEYGGQIANIAQWGNSGNFYTYNPRLAWIDYPFSTIMPQIYTGFFQMKQTTGGEGISYRWAQILRIFGTLRLSDMYGPLPYSKVTGSEFTVPYDDMEELYNNMFADLDEAIEGLTTVALSGEDMSSLSASDFVYNGDFTKWVKLANTLKLRMAVRISSANAILARQKAEEAVSHTIGVMNSAQDAAWYSDNDGMNPYYRVAFSWQEIRVSANVTSYLSGYNDPRLSIYVNPSELASGDRVGVRNGIYQSAGSQASYANYSRMNIGELDKLLVMSASEAYFLRAEGALLGWNMQGTAKQLYEQGVAVSMEERGANMGNYLLSDNTPANYVDPLDSSKNHNAMSSISPRYDESASKEANLERILVQKWLANFPNGWETWADIRRTGYPKHFPVINNLNTDGVTSTRGMRRLPYPQSEYNTNAASVKAAVSMLGGADNGATDLWWAKKN